ncbi:MAG: hypothetical protein OXI60_06970 [Acidiferrobacterales bacterium]|nr:hypothetical protein [Acidiferrobacterales bacterium]
MNDSISRLERATSFIGSNFPNIRAKAVFGNPFQSFHDTVAEAKHDREQLDRLLIVSTPRERLVLAVTVSLLVIFTGWLFFGSMTRSFTADGIFVGSVDNPSETNRSVQVLIWVNSGSVRDIHSKLPIKIQLGETDDNNLEFNGKIAKISSEPISGELARFEAQLPISVHRVDVIPDEQFDLSSYTDTNCRVTIQLGTRLPIALFRNRQS